MHFIPGMGQAKSFSMLRQSEGQPSIDTELPSSPSSPSPGSMSPFPQPTTQPTQASGSGGRSAVASNVPVSNVSTSIEGWPRSDPPGPASEGSADGLRTPAQPAASTTKHDQARAVGDLGPSFLEERILTPPDE